MADVVENSGSHSLRDAGHAVTKPDEKAEAAAT
jgi:hypothetical protein